MKISYLLWAILIGIDTAWAVGMPGKEKGVKQNAELEGQCKQFMHTCIAVCERRAVYTVTSTCTFEDASCLCNQENISSEVYAELLQDVQEIQRGAGGLVESSTYTQPQDEVYRQPQAAKGIRTAFAYGKPEYDSEPSLIDRIEQGGDTRIEQEQNTALQEYIHPNPTLMENHVFQRQFCTQFLIRCKQDCPAAFSSYGCKTNAFETGFLLSCICNGVDLASPVNEQVQAESKFT